MLLAHHSRAYPPHATPAPTHSVEAGILLPTRRNQGSRFVHPRNQGADPVHRGAFSAPRRRRAEPGIRRCPNAEPKISPASIWQARLIDIRCSSLPSSKRGFVPRPLAKQRVRLLSIDATRVRVSSICATRVRIPSIQRRFPRPDGAEPNPEFTDVQTPNPGSRRCPNPEPKISPASIWQARLIDIRCSSLPSSKRGFVSRPLVQQRVRVSSIRATRVRIPSIQGRFLRPDGAEPNPEFADVQTPNPGSRRCPNPEPKISPSSSRRAPGEQPSSSRRTRLTKPTGFNPAEPIPP